MYSAIMNNLFMLSSIKPGSHVLVHTHGRYMQLNLSNIHGSQYLA